ncbi:MAG: hypothetical protein LBN26_07690 [Christensenellaceae bacterium]|jgi:hypothetical protein|nr:hypothetical protein [Christensenellaceae bacterium]
MAKKALGAVALLLLALLALAAAPPSAAPPPTALAEALARADEVWSFSFTPLFDLPGGIYKAGVTYHEVPYGQDSIDRAGDHLLLFEVPLERFAAELLDPDSVLYTDTEYRDYRGLATPYYNLDCSGYVSYIVGLSRHSTANLSMAAIDGTELYFGNADYSDIRAGDILNIAGEHTRWVWQIEGDRVYYYEQRGSGLPATRKHDNTIAELQSAGYVVIHVRAFD